MTQLHPQIFYEIFVRSFADSNGDGIGDLNGITAKLDYLEDLGVEGLWLSPIFLSPSYHKYDVKDYRMIDPEFGTLADFERLISEAHRRGIKVIIDLVINHSSSQHAWFKESSQNKSSQFRDFYHWLSPKEIKEKNIGRRRATDDSGVEFPWHWSSADQSEKYFGMFWKEMPDLNFSNPQLQTELIEIAKYWLSKGVDGFRLDAAKHIFPSWEPIEKAHQFWKHFSDTLKEIKPDVYLVGEVWDSPDVVAPFFSSLQANFNIDLSFELQKMLANEKDEIGLVEKLIKAHQLYALYTPNFIDAILLSNHDQVRIGSTLKGNINKLKQAANLLFTLPGQPYLYYGEELGMKGKKPDEHIREPFPWRNEFQTHWIPERYNKRLAFENEAKEKDSLLNHYKRRIKLRKEIPALTTIYGNLELANSSADGCLLFIRKHANGDVLVIHNLKNEDRFFELEGDDKQFKRLLFADQLVKFVNGKYRIPAYGLLILTNSL